MAEERIQKIMAEQGLCSRRAAEQIIAEGRVKVNGHPVKVGDKMDPNRDVLISRKKHRTTGIRSMECNRRAGLETYTVQD